MVAVVAVATGTEHYDASSEDIRGRAPLKNMREVTYLHKAAENPKVESNMFGVTTESCEILAKINVVCI